MMSSLTAAFQPGAVLALAIPEPTPSVNWVALLPYLVLIGGGLLMLTIYSVAGRFLPSWFAASYTATIGVATLGSCIGIWHYIGDRGPSSTLAGMLGIDRFSIFVIATLGAVVSLVALLAHDYIKREQLWGNEIYVLLMLSAAGGAIMASANDLIVMFLGLEVLSIAAYILAAFYLRKQASLEAGLKYFVLGAFASAFLLYGIALLYGATGSTQLASIRTFTGAGLLEQDGLLLAGLALLLVGLFFKVAAVPFHSWTPDVYQGSPTPVVGYMAAGVKIAGFAALLRVLTHTFEAQGSNWQPIVYAVAILTMLVGSTAAIAQGDVKRMLAYSSISHAGFVLVALEANTADGTAAALFYLAAYAVIAVGSFAVVSVVAGKGDSRTSLEDYRGLAGRHPVLSAALLVLLLAQAGVPFTSGFFAKFFVISAAVDARSFWLAIAAMALAVIAAFIYLRLLVTMYLSGDDSEAEADTNTEASAATSTATIVTTPRERLVITICVAFTVVFGIIPGVLYDLASDALIAIVP